MIQQLSTTELEDLLGHIDTDAGNRESECAEILKKAASVLLPLEEGFKYANSEVINSAGRLDLIVIGQQETGGGRTQTTAFIWELKSPQKAVFHLENNSRAAPTNDLFSAENQLLHYYQEVLTSGSLRARFNNDHVHPAGIIIGRLNTFCRIPTGVDVPQEQAVNLAEHCLKIRSDYFYATKGIRVLTWTQIYRRLQNLHQGQVPIAAAVALTAPMQSADIAIQSISGFVGSDEFTVDATQEDE